VTEPGYEGKPNAPYHWEKTSDLGADDVLSAFRNSYNPRIAVTVDMIATGTDVKPIEVVMFLRNVKSPGFFEQMKGRGVRVIKEDDLRQVTPDAHFKDRFIIVDSVGVCEQVKTESAPLNCRPNVSLKKLLDLVAVGNTHPDVLSSLGVRLARLDRQIEPETRKELKQLAKGKDLAQLSSALFKAADPDEYILAARIAAGLEPDKKPSDKQVKSAAEELARTAVQPFHDPHLRRRILEIQRDTEQVIDTLSTDELITAELAKDTKDRAQDIVQNFRKWIEDNKDEITALQVLFSGQYANRLKLRDVKDLADRIKRPPVGTTPGELWHAFEVLEGRPPRENRLRSAADVIRLVRHAITPAEPLAPFGETVMQRYDAWLKRQTDLGTTFTPEQKQWLDRIAETIATSVSFERDDFDLGWFSQHGQLGKAHQLFGKRLNNLISSMNEALAA
jgi:type I restriction enzyme R subunit